MENDFEQKQLNQEIEKIEGLLRRHSVSLDLWGKDGAKTLNHLAKELQEGDSELVETETGELVRRIAAVDVGIRYVNENGHIYELKEVKQVFADGRERVRPEISSIAEKIKIGESSKQTALRAIREELGIVDQISVEFIRTENKNKTSASFPGLVTKYDIHFYEATLNSQQYKSEGYVEKQSDKTTFFEWVEVK